MTISSFRDLRVWQAGMDLVESVYRVTLNFPGSELYALTAQMRRAAISVPSNIAEGHSRAHGKEYLHHLSIAQASLADLETQLEISARLEYLSSKELQSILSESQSLGRQLRALRKALLKND